MRFNTTLKILGSTIVCLFFFSVKLNGQIYSFKSFGAEYGIPNGFVYTINQSNDGFLWVGMGTGLYRFDGFNFQTVQYPDSSAGRYPTKSLKDKKGTLWFGCSDGSVYYARENKLIRVNLSNSKSISDLLEGPDGMIYIIPQGKPIFRVNPLKPAEVHKFTFPISPVMFSASFTKSGNLLIGTQENLLIFRLEKDSLMVKSVVEGFDYSAVTTIHKTDDSSRFVLGTDGNGLFQLRISEKGNVLTRFRDHPEWGSLNIQSIIEDTDHYLWVSTYGSGVIQFHFSENFETVKSVRNYNINSGLTANDVRTVFQDIEGNYWFGLYGEGISMLTSYAFVYYTPGKNSSENNIIYVNSLNDKYILGTPSGFHLFDPVIGMSVSFTDLTKEVDKTEITSYYLDQDNNLWIGTGGNGLFVRNASGSVRLVHKSGDSGADNIKDIEMDNGNIWLATTNGVIVLDRSTGNKRKSFDITNGLPHNSISKIIIAHDGNAYIGTESDRLYKIDHDFNVTSGNATMNGSTINKITSLSQSKDGAIWAATKGNGVFECINDSITAINRTNDLMSIYCYSILADSEYNIWIGHEKGFSRFRPETGIMRIFGTDFAKGGVCNPDGNV